MSLTKICNLLLVLFLSISFYSCADSEPEGKAPIKEQQQRKKANNKSDSAYWSQLKKSTGITKNQQQKITKIAAKYNKLKKAVPKVNGKINQKRINELKQTQLKEIEKLLGKNLFAKKKVFDQQWLAKQKRNK